MKNIEIRKMKFFLYYFLCAILCVSCYGEDYDATDQVGASVNQEDEKLTWEQQLGLVQQKGKKVMTRSRLIGDSELQLKGYVYLGKINSAVELDRVRSTITSDNSYIPYYNIEKNKIQILNWKELQRSKKYDNIEYSKQKMSDFIQDRIEIGMEKVELTWECGTEEYNSLCIVSTKGIVYDNIISNIICISDEPLTTSTPINHNMIKTRSETSASGIRWRHYENCIWLWGSERGSVELTHEIYGTKNNLQNSNCHADGYMSIGKFEAKIDRIEYKRGEGGRSVCAYGFYMATPSADVSLSFSGKSYSVTISSSGISSPITGTGINELSSASLN